MQYDMDVTIQHWEKLGKNHQILTSSTELCRTNKVGTNRKS